MALCVKNQCRFKAYTLGDTSELMQRDSSRFDHSRGKDVSLG